MPTFARHLAAAQLSLRLLERYWEKHPPTFLCGVIGRDPAVLPLDENPADWMATVRCAIRHLEARGFSRVYMILDDQGPTDLCHAVHLNRTVPDWMEELDAVYISIRGWDHPKYAPGKRLSGRYLGLKRQSPHFVQRFALHPALWRIDVLAQILDHIMQLSPIHRSAWHFEISAGQLNDRLPRHWNESTYRVCGRLMTAMPIGLSERLRRHMVDGSVRWIDSTLHWPLFGRAKWSPRWRSVITNLLQLDAFYYQGPYPMHFSGFARSGRINPDAIRYFHKRNRHDLVQEIEAAAPIVPIRAKT